MNEELPSYSHDQITKQLEITPRQLIYFAEKGVVKPQKKAKGRGSARGYTLDNVAEIKLGILLRNAGMEVHYAAKVADAYRELASELNPQDFTFFVLDGDNVYFTNDQPNIKNSFALVIQMAEIRPVLEKKKNGHG